MNTLTPEAAFQLTHAALLAIPSASLVRVNRDPDDVAPMALAAVQRLAPLADELADLFHGQSPQLEALETQALAFLFAHRRWAAITQTPSTSSEPVRDALVCRRRLRVAVLCLEAWESLDQGTAHAIPHGRAAAGFASELLSLVRVLRPQLAVIARHMPKVDAAMLGEAEALAARVLGTAGADAAAREMNAAAFRLDRQRAFTALVETYARIRGVLRVRHSDAEINALMPPLRRGFAPHSRTTAREKASGAARAAE